MVEINKYVGAVVLVALTLTLIDMIGDRLFESKQDGAPDKHAAAPPAVKKAAPKAPAPAAALAPVTPLLATASEENGRKVFKKCAACHSTSERGRNRLGPNLWNIINARRGRVGGFRYSKGLLSKAGNWSYESLNAFLAAPKTYIAGTRMSFAGLKRARDRADVIVYLRSLSEFPVPLP